jgi:hypothetical protein
VCREVKIAKFQGRQYFRQRERSDVEKAALLITLDKAASQSSLVSSQPRENFLHINLSATVVRHCLLNRRDRTLLLRLLLNVTGQRTGIVLQRRYRCLLVWCKRLLRCVGVWWCACWLHRCE